MPSVNSQHKKWCFTINNPVDGDDPGRALEPLTEGIKYAVWQLERGENGTPHWQGFVEWKSRGRRLNGMKALFPRAHLEVSRGTCAQNREYCTKEEGRLEGPYEIGECPEGPGSRSDLKAVKRRLDEGASMKDISEEFFSTFVRYHRGLMEYKRMRVVERNWQTKVRVFYGPTGIGKSFLVKQLAEEEARALGTSVYYLTRTMMHQNGVWWDGYDGHEVVVIDEFEGWICRNVFKLLVNALPMEVQVKGATSVQFVARTIYITSNVKPCEWWKMETVAQRNAWPEIKRRLSEPIGQVDRVRANPDHGEPDNQGVISDFLILEGECDSLIVV
jgi:hypothetical protein